MDHDAQIELDGPVWKTLSQPCKKALLDHELTHLVVKRDRKTEKIKLDDLNRPVLATRPDDWSSTGFLDVVARHGQASLEYQAIQRLHEAVQQAAQKAAEKIAAA